MHTFAHMCSIFHLSSWRSNTFCTHPKRRGCQGRKWNANGLYACVTTSIWSAAKESSSALHLSTLTQNIIFVYTFCIVRTGIKKQRNGEWSPDVTNCKHKTEQQWNNKYIKGLIDALMLSIFQRWQRRGYWFSFHTASAPPQAQQRLF